MGDTSVIFDIIGRDFATPGINKIKDAFLAMSLAVVGAAAIVGEKTIHMAGDFQAAMTRVQTGAGELQSNMAMVSAGVLDMAGKVGQSTHELTAGLYMVNSAGYHGADGLHVLEIAAMGAKVGAAELGTVADAVTTALNAYHMGAGGAAEAMNALIGAEKAGKTNMEALAGSLSKVAPAAAVAGVSLNEVLAAMATMTAQGTSADVAATYLRQTILQLSNPTQKAKMEMEALGLSAIDVSTNLGKNGLASTLTMLTDAIQSKMGPAGIVLIDQLRKASGDATQFEKVMANLPPTQQTYIAALANMVGGTKSMQAALQLTGQNMATFQANIKGIDENVKLGAGSVEGWAAVQKNFNQQMAEAKGTVEALGIKIGTALLPKAQEALNTTMDLVNWFTKHKTVAQDLAVAVTSLGTAFLVYKAGKLAVEGYNAVAAAARVITKLWTVEQWSLNAAMDANPIGLIIIAIALLVAAVYELAIHWKGVTHALNTGWTAVVGWFKSAGGWLADFFTKTIPGWWDHVVSSVVDFKNKVVAAVMGLVMGVVHWFEAIPGKVLAAVRALPHLVIAVFESMLLRTMHAAGFYLGLIVGFFIKLPHRLVQAWHTLPPMIWHIITSLWDGAVQRVEDGYHATIAWFERVGPAIWAWIKGLPAMLWHTVTDMWDGAVAKVEAGYHAAIDWFAKLGPEIWEYVKGIPDRMLHLGEDILNGLINGINSLVGHLWDLAKHMASEFIKGFKDGIKSSSPSKVFYEIAVSGIGGGLISGIEDLHVPVKASAEDLAGATVAGYAAGAPKQLVTARSAAASSAAASSGPMTVHVAYSGNDQGLDAMFHTWLKKSLRTGALKLTVSNDRVLPA